MDEDHETGTGQLINTPTEGLISQLITSDYFRHEPTIATLIEQGFCYMSEHGGHEGLIEPSSYEQAMKQPEADHWREAMKKEVEQLNANQTWILTSLPPGRKAIDGRWVYKVKIGADNKIQKFKARWVARGFAQIPGVDFDQTFAPTVRPATAKVILTLIANFDLHAVQLDVILAFLNSRFSEGETIYVVQPKGFEDGTDRVCQLLRPLYGLKQAARLWYLTFKSGVKKIGLKPAKSDECLFVREDGLILMIHVDDMVMTGPSKSAVIEAESALGQLFNVTSLGEITYYLGMKIDRDVEHHKISLSQKAYLQRMLDTYDGDSTKISKTPMEEGAKFTKAPVDYNADPHARKRYQAQIGSLLYPMLITRPDLAFALTKLSRYSSNPLPEHERGVTRIMRYVRKTLDYAITIQGDDSNNPLERLGKVLGYVDADYARDLDTRRSTTGSVYMFANAPITWASKLQATVSLSTCEAEYNAIVTTAKEAIWLSYLLTDLRFANVKPMRICTDSQSAMKLAYNPQFHARTKHIDVKHHWIREAISDRRFELTYINTKDQIADGFTKALGWIKFEAFVKALGIVPGGV